MLVVVIITTAKEEVRQSSINKPQVKDELFLTDLVKFFHVWQVNQVTYVISVSL